MSAYCDIAPGHEFHGPYHDREYGFPTKDEMADYLEAYATRFALPVRTGARVDRISRNGHGLAVSATDQQLEAEHG